MDKKKTRGASKVHITDCRAKQLPDEEIAQRSEDGSPCRENQRGKGVCYRLSHYPNTILGVLMDARATYKERKKRQVKSRRKARGGATLKSEYSSATYTANNDTTNHSQNWAVQERRGNTLRFSGFFANYKREGRPLKGRSTKWPNLSMQPISAP